MAPAALAFCDVSLAAVKPWCDWLFVVSRSLERTKTRPGLAQGGARNIDFRTFLIMAEECPLGRMKEVAGMTPIDPTSFIPDSIKQRLFGAVIDFLVDQAEKVVSGQVADTLKKLRSDAEFREAFDQALERAVHRFVDGYAMVDREVVVALMRQPTGFWEAKPVQHTLREMIRRPGTYLEPERKAIERSFAGILPGFDPDRVNRAVAHFLSLLAEEVMVIPQLQPLYMIQLQRMTLEQGREMVSALRDLQADQRQAMMALLEVVSQFPGLSAGERMALPEPPCVYHNLPQPDYGHFVGRDEELDRIHQLLKPYPQSRYHIITIDGIGGIGKSTLALEAAYRYLRHYDILPPEERFDAIIWASAKQNVLTADGIVSRRQALRTLDDVYTTISTTLEREDITRARAEEQPALMDRALCQQRTLLILDNFETVDDEQVLTFVREVPDPTKVMVTTRHHIDVAYPVRLMGMPKADGLALIQQECKEKGVTITDADALKLYKRTGGVPLAMVWSVAQIGYGYNVETLLRRLAQPTSDMARYCFEAALKHVRGQPAHRLLMALALFVPDASREALGYVADLPEFDRDDGLVELERLSLVNRRAGRFQFLPLTMVFAADELRGAPIRSNLEDRWIDYFVTLSEEYGDEYWNWLNYDWLMAEGENILALAEWAIGVGRPEIVLKLHYPILRYLDVEGRWVEVIRYGTFLYDIAQSLNARRTMAWICTHWLSWLYGEQGDVSRSEKLAREGIALYRALEDKKGECLSLAFLSRAFRKGGRFEESRKTVQQMLQFAQDIGYSDGVATAHDQLGKIARDLSIWTEAKEYFDRARAWCEGEDANLDISLLMNIYGNLGWTEFHLGNHERGKELCERSLDFFRRIGGRGYTTALHCQLADIELALGNHQKAREHAKEALYWAERLQILRDAKRARELFEQISGLESSDTGV
jgi:LuxR family glucitol operon transcriptional activator